MEKARLYEKLFFKVIIVMVKVIKYSIKDTVSIKISFMHYMKRTRVVMATVVLEESDVFLFFFLLLSSFQYHRQLVKRNF